MTNGELQKSWAATLRHLAASRYHLPERLEGEALGAASQLDYLNEFGLALEEAEAGNWLNRMQATGRNFASRLTTWL